MFNPNSQPTGQRNGSLDKPLETVTGVVDVITHADAESGFGILKLRIFRKGEQPLPHYASRKGTVTLVGDLARISIGETLQVAGELKFHNKYGHQILVHNFSIMPPRTHADIARYLARHIHLIGHKTADAIVAKFGEHTIEIIDSNPDRLLEIEGIGEKRLGEIKAIWEEQKTYRQLLMFATKIGLGSSYLERIYKKYKADAVERIKQDPYSLARDIWGIGFAKADEVAKHLGIVETSSIRIRAATEFLLNERSQSEGHCFEYRHTLISQTHEFLTKDKDYTVVQRITPEIVTQCLDEAVKLKVLFQEDNRVYLPHLLEAETFAAQTIAHLIAQPLPYTLQGSKLEEAILAAEEQSQVPLQDTQREAVRRTLGSKVSVITGGPGTGKTTITKAVVAGFRHAELRVTLLAPTGRAAKRMREVIGHNASTIHKELYGIAKAVKDGAALESVQLRGVIIVDESSMVDVLLLSKLLRYIHESAILVIVGDKDQLPSIGPGAVLRDLIDCQPIPTTQLTQIFRQEAGSDIIENAHAINNGRMPILKQFGQNHGMPKTDMLFVPQEDAELQAVAAIYCATKLAKHMGFNPVQDCMVLSPMHKGPAGVANLNKLLQQTLNPNPSDFVMRGPEVKWCVGDRLMQTKNNYSHMIMNGDIGIISKITKNENNKLESVTINFDGEEVTICQPTEFGDLQLAYASTIHKVQGSEFPFVVMVIHTSHYVMLVRNLLYTGATRSRKINVLIAHPRALSSAISNNKVAKRNSFFKEKVATFISQEVSYA